MFTLSLALLATARLIQATDDRPSHHVHGVVAFIRHGEVTPSSPRLTERGAQQMIELGQAFRGRYIGDFLRDGFGNDPIEGLSTDYLDPGQLYIQTLDRAYMQASAQAFVQGMYPPFDVSEAEDGGGALVGNESSQGSGDVPLPGFQYAPVQSLSEWDPQSVFVAGEQNCRSAVRASMQYYSTNEYAEKRKATQGFYDELDPELFGDQVDTIDYINAIQLYELLSYISAHNATTHPQLSNTTILSTLKSHADEISWYLWGNITNDSTDDYTLPPGDVRAMPGRTLAAHILLQLSAIIETPQQSPPVSLLFGDYKPLTSVFSLLQINSRQPTPDFRSLPPHASAIIVELFSTGPDPAFPNDVEDLWVNLHWHNSTEGFEGKLQAYPIFAAAPRASDMRWSEFERLVQGVSTEGVGEWCDVCESSAVFCSGVDGFVEAGGREGGALRDGRVREENGVSKTVAGVIGAVVALVVAGVLFALAALLGGVRVRRDPVRSVFSRRKSEVGGYKGSAKLASDADVTLKGNGAMPAGAGVGTTGQGKGAHERVGSWELRQKEFGREGDLGEMSPRGSFEAIEAAMGMGRPVVANERV
ncbi:phosphoglycerate mutase-like protein [Sporormia fimetaria CBS 119925]|uniref:Phosphoglycerate mutase-like protein n=1 Tax=Sporormia fimetaria CBS 119925 TaxID=1340428 RepID=A0A6A6V6T7_9PLEO|nr:phosphoglycerate mutase-like protein [Sporormia fimetaria CBS 119925]